MLALDVLTHTRMRQSFVVWTLLGCACGGIANTEDAGVGPVDAHAEATTADVADASCTMPCTTTPPSQAACIDGRCVVTLATHHEWPQELVADESFVYWFDEASSSSAIVRVPTGGGAPAVLASGVLVSSLTSDVGSLYWTEALSGDVMKMDKTGSVPSPVVGNAQATQAPHGIAVDGTSVYWIANTGVITIRKAPLGGGAPVDLVTAPSLVFAIAIDSTHLYWTTQAGLFSANLDGTNVAEIAAPGPIASLGVVDETVYWGRDDDVYATALDGSSLSIAHFASTVEADVALDSTSIYLSTSEPILRRVSLDGKTSEKLAPALAHHIALNSTHVFWTDILQGGVGVIMATPK